MKKNLLVIFFLLISATLISQNQVPGSNKGEIAFAVRNHETKFWLFLNDVLQNENSVNSIKVTDLPLQNFRVRIVFNNQEHSELNQEIMITPNANRNLYFVRMTKDRFVIENARGINYIQLTQIWNPGRQNVPPMPGTPQGNSQQGHPQHSTGCGGCPNGGNHAHSGCPNSGQGNQGQNPHSGCAHGQPPVPACMNARDFQIALSRVDNQTFENDKLSLAKGIVEKNRMSTRQIIAICRTFNFENSKLEFAKFAYRFCTDPESYYQVEEVFSFASSKAALMDFISR